MFVCESELADETVDLSLSRRFGELSICEPRHPNEVQLPHMRPQEALVRSINVVFPLLA